MTKVSQISIVDSEIKVSFVVSFIQTKNNKNLNKPFIFSKEWKLVLQQESIYEIRMYIDVDENKFEKLKFLISINSKTKYTWCS